LASPGRPSEPGHTWPGTCTTVRSAEAQRELDGRVGWMSWRILITELRWSWDEAERWLTQRGIEALLQQERRIP
jgi:hypothetical protein